jgi:hypothetical protein
MCHPREATIGITSSAGSRESIDLYWLPLGAGGHSVRLNGRVYEALAARLGRRPARDLYHSALEVQVEEGRFVIETAPLRTGDDPERGVVAEGAVGSRWAARSRLFRYELRCWRDGVIPDVAEAVESPRRLSDDPEVARRLLALVPCVPMPVWGRDELRAGEMWNSNSVIAWLIAQAGIDAEAIEPPPGGRAPGWNAGLVVARRHEVHARQRTSQRASGAATRFPLLRTAILTWGATSEEAASRLPGDELLEDADGVSTRAITIDAPAASVWPWIAQMGPSPRGGAYTYDWIENLLRLDMHSVDCVLTEFQHPEVGDTISLGPNRMRLQRVEPQNVLAWRSEDGNWVWTFVLAECDGTTRLISRNRFRLPTRAARIAMLPMEPASLLMERRMLHGIKERAERLASARLGMA